VALPLAAQLAVIYVLALNPIFTTSPLPLVDLLGCIALGAVVLLAKAVPVQHR